MKKRLRLGRITEDTLRNALLYIRAECLRDGAPGLEHAEAILRLRGHDPDAFVTAAKCKHHFKRNELSRKIFEVLRDGPLRGTEIAERVRGDMEPRLAYKRTYQALWRLKANGIVRNDTGLWGLSP